MKDTEQLRTELNAMLLNKKQLAKQIGMNYHDLVRFLNGGELSSRSIIKANKFLQ